MYRSPGNRSSRAWSRAALGAVLALLALPSAALAQSGTNRSYDYDYLELRE